MARRTKEEALETREQVLDAAEQVFLQRGVGHASLAEVADAAGVTPRAIYHHFASKAELFEAMLARAEMPIDAAFDNAQIPVADPLGAVRETALKALLHLTSCERVRTIFEVAFPALRVHRRSGAGRATPSAGARAVPVVLWRPARTGGRARPVAGRHRYSSGVAPPLRVHRRADARLGAGAGELRPQDGRAAAGRSLPGRPALGAAPQGPARNTSVTKS